MVPAVPEGRRKHELATVSLVGGLGPESTIDYYRGDMKFQIDHAIAVLERTPATLSTLLTDVPEAWTAANEGPDTWSPFDIVGHLIHGERTDWIARTKIILAQGPNRRFEPYDRFAQFRESRGRSLGMLLATFEELRAQNLEMLRDWALTEDQLELVGVHPAFGDVTLRELLATWTVHDLGHIAQITRTMAKQYATAVGPWKEYLPVLSR